jgi:hypothetical protein
MTLNTTKMILCALLALLLFGSCGAPSMRLHPTLIADQEALFVNGRELVISQGSSSNVAMHALRKGQDLVLKVVYENTSRDETITVRPQALRITGFDPKGEAVDLHVYSPEEVMQRRESAQAWAMALQGVAAGLESYNTGETSQRTQDNIEKTAQGFARSNANTEQKLLKSHTLFPGDFLNGNVRANATNLGNRFDIVVPLGDDLHSFQFKP